MIRCVKRQPTRKAENINKDAIDSVCFMRLSYKLNCMNCMYYKLCDEYKQKEKYVNRKDRYNG